MLNDFTTIYPLLEASAALAASTVPAPGLTNYETAILGHLSAFPRCLAPYIARIEETCVRGLYRVTFEGAPSRTVFDMIDTSRVLRTVGGYSVCDGAWAQDIRLVSK